MTPVPGLHGRYFLDAEENLWIRESSGNLRRKPRSKRYTIRARLDGKSISYTA